MIFLADTSQDFSVLSAEMGGIEVQQLITPLNGFRLKAEKFGVDNGAYSGFDADKFLRLLKREEENKSKCLFVAAPDVVGSARRTLEVFWYWVGKLDSWPVALVAQDGIENLEIPWSSIAAIFVGGSTAWKQSPDALAVIKAAKMLNKYVHAGRVNTPNRWEWFSEAGADSCDGQGLSQYTGMREAIHARSLQQRLVA